MKKQKGCAKIDQFLDTAKNSADDTLPPEARRHVDECERCKALMQMLNRPEEWKMPEGALDRLQGPFLQSLKPVSPLPAAPVFLLLFFLIFVVLAVAGVYQLGPFGWDVLTVFQKVVIFTSLAASAALLGFSAVRQMVPGSKYPFSPALLPLSVFVLLSLVVAGVFQYENDPYFIRAGMGCLQAGIPYAIPALLLFWLILRRGAVLHPYISGATSGMLAGLIGTSVLEMHCPILDMRHILVWHLGVCLAGALAGLLAAYGGTAFRHWRESSVKASL